MAVAFPPAGECLASGSKNGTIRLWNLQGEVNQILKGHTSAVWAVTFLPEGKDLDIKSQEVASN
jgi:WD40 repeat protein